ncbi:MAG: 50S ribosomal protein L16 [Candidatus Pacebacteria bacterium]|jgi:large subunit ribosomal protein L16|nr:50S ribosomal protein L16 [Parcubacteria group bacterium]MDP6249676.1 50S ribosomal protein L16 [Candidatus Paceibacterota bacterium]MDP7159345.1 50S ribosomal protein L16 [Candidatus Paceibacterota bacterium]MDP7368415.1 50S ribosomal protein L16 [Candidatus Paceibacterota bacterium]MDP7466350.1 50S ribosomal protein L16 [Candidatus Paceibacterota bacterium]|tara:strand:+ start:171 stop:587 length:417 start_codon:yes stop_codon:yes gene_type:complete
MLFPKKVKYRKWQTRRKNPKKIGAATRGNSLSFGAYGLKSMKYVRIKSNQIEAARRVISRAMGKSGRIWIRAFPDRPFTAKPAEVGMGKGKGDLQGYQFEVFPGTIVFEVDGVEESIAREALRKAGAKLPLTSKIVSR